MAELDEEVQSFLDRYIDSIERLEVLLLLQRHPDRRWTANAVASELRISAAAADAHLAKLCAYTLLNVQIGNDLFYWYSPRPEHLARAAKALETAYIENRLAVIKFILERPSKPVRDFAEAFRITKRDEPDG